jgi:hypothetical protein
VNHVPTNYLSDNVVPFSLHDDPICLVLQPSHALMLVNVDTNEQCAVQRRYVATCWLREDTSAGHLPKIIATAATGVLLIDSGMVGRI